MAEQIEWIHDVERLASLSKQWDQLAAANVSPFGDHPWFTAWWNAFGEGELQMCVLWRGHRLCAALPLYAKNGRLQSMVNHHTPLFSAPASDSAALDSVVEAAFSFSPGELAIDALRTSDPLREQIARSSDRRKRLLLVEAMHRSPRVDISGGFEAYMHERHSATTNIRRRWRKVNREHEVTFEFRSSVDDLEATLREVFAVEASGWKGRGGSAILSSSRTRAFYASLAHAYQARGELRLALLSIDGALAGFNLCLLRGQRLYPVKTGFAEEFRRYSPGLLVNLCTIEKCFELDIQSFEMLGADEPWKAYFANAASDHVRLRSYRRSAVMIRYLARRFGRPVALAASRRRARR